MTLVNRQSVPREAANLDGRIDRRRCYASFFFFFFRDALSPSTSVL